MGIFIVPKNSGLKKYVNVVDAGSAKRVKVRGEDVASFLDNLGMRGLSGVGVTGEDLFEEFMRLNPDSRLRVVKRIEWDEEGFVFGKPCFCLLGRVGGKIGDFSGKVRVCVNSKYKKIFSDYAAENLGDFDLEVVYAKGATEEFFEEGLVDLVAEIVCTGSSIRDAGLEVYDRIFSSDVVVIENVVSSFGLDDLYNVVKDRVDSGREGSFTVSLRDDINLLNRKIVEEAGEIVTSPNRENLIWEISDIMYFLLVKMVCNDISFDDINAENFRRNRESLGLGEEVVR